MVYRDKVVIITGGSHGIGEGCVRAFAAAGANVVFCARNVQPGARLAEEVNARTTMLVQAGEPPRRSNTMRTNP